MERGRRGGFFVMGGDGERGRSRRNGGGGVPTATCGIGIVFAVGFGGHGHVHRQQQHTLKFERERVGKRYFEKGVHLVFAPLFLFLAKKHKKETKTGRHEPARLPTTTTMAMAMA
jgi:hypothetical protein